MSESQIIESTVGVQKCPTGIVGLDQITEGGIPKGRTTLVCGGPGCGKTVLGMEFLVRGARDYDEPGVFMAFEETTRELTENFGSMQFDIERLRACKQLYIEQVRVERNNIEVSGEFDLEGLFIRLQAALDSVQAKRLVLDTIECLFSGFRDATLLRSELRRLFSWLKERNITAVLTGEATENRLTRRRLEEFVADCVIFLDNRIVNQNSTRRLRIIKYRGSVHGSNEYPFLITKGGLSVLPAEKYQLLHPASTERISMGIPRLDDMLGGQGVYRGASVLVSGAAGTGKTSLAAHFVRAVCERGERALYFASEQSGDEILRDMRSIGIDLEPYQKRDLLRFRPLRANACGLEQHLVLINEQIDDFDPAVVVVDPITNFDCVGSPEEVKAMLSRLMDFLKSRQITALFNSLTAGDAAAEDSMVGVSSLMDNWLLVRNLEMNRERNRALYVLKSRGTANSNQIREFVLTDHGAELLDVYAGPNGVLTGSARAFQEARDRTDELQITQEIEAKKLQLERKRQQMDAQINMLRAEFEAQELELRSSAAQLQLRSERLAADRLEAAHLRQASNLFPVIPAEEKTA
jgi:circadian clock protein KaiC